MSLFYHTEKHSAGNMKQIEWFVDERASDVGMLSIQQVAFYCSLNEWRKKNEQINLIAALIILLWHYYQQHWYTAAAVLWSSGGIALPSSRVLSLASSRKIIEKRRNIYGFFFPNWLFIKSPLSPCALCRCVAFPFFGSDNSLQELPVTGPKVRTIQIFVSDQTEKSESPDQTRSE